MDGKVGEPRGVALKLVGESHGKPASRQQAPPLVEDSLVSLHRERFCTSPASLSSAGPRRRRKCVTRAAVRRRRRGTRPGFGWSAGRPDLRDIVTKMRPANVAENRSENRETREPRT